MEIENKGDVTVNPAQDELQGRRDRLLVRRATTQRFLSFLVPASVLLLIFGPLLAWRLYKESYSYAVWSLFLFYSVLPLTVIPSYRLRLRQIENDLQELDFQIDLQQFDVSMQERRAEKILRINDFQLRRYYDLNLMQNSWVFGLGVFCILLGVAVIGITLFLVIKVADSFETRLITASLGSIGAILSNFVAVIYLKMNASATENLASFHSRLVETQKLLFGNLLASRIEDDEKRWATLSQLSVRLMDDTQIKGHNGP